MSAPVPSGDRLLRAEYDRLVDADVFGDERVELLYGRVVAMTPRGTEHDGAIVDLQDLLARVTAGRARLRVQSAFAATDDSRPEPDLALVPVASYRKAHPSKAFLIVEIAYSSLEHDRGKAAIYAAAGVPEYWIVDLVHDAVLVHRRPVGDRYAQVSMHRRPDVLRPEAFPDVEVPLDVVLATE